MQFSDTSNLTGIIEQITFQTGMSTTNYTLKDRTREVNEAFNVVASLILRGDGRMQWDDTNHTNQPVATLSMVANQKDYNVFSTAPTALQDWLQVERVEIKDPDGNWIKLNPIDENDIPLALDAWDSTAGLPQYFDFEGTQVFLYPTPSYNSTDGMKMHFKRAPSYFISTDTTKKPGFATVFHQFLPLYASYKWGLKTGNQNCLNLKAEIGNFAPGQETGLARDILTFYSKRPSKYETPVLSRSYKNFK